MKKNTIWYERMLAKYKTDEAIKRVMSEAGSKGVVARKNSGKKWVGGFSNKTKEELSELARKGNATKWGNKDESSNS